MVHGFENGADAVKGDFRVSQDNVGVVVHSSPFHLYESVNCVGRRVENMTAAQIQRCQMEMTTFTFQTAPSLLAWADGKVNVMFCVKEARDIPRAISTIIDAGAQHRAFLEIRAGTLLQVPALAPPGWDQVFYLAELGSAKDIDAMLAAPAALLQQTWGFEFDPSYEKWGLNITQVIDGKLRPRNISSLAATAANPTASEENHLQLWRQGFDVVYTYNLANAVKARVVINSGRGLSPAAEAEAA